ncbi:hypothetical protein ACSAZK_03100 [Methanosarcina sp. Mfa9]|uniref:hypothetical protein n=1 Tax=Methanosarcina sp. Mfa9 TaxID=3439063 RepID=UPI003F834833
MGNKSAALKNKVTDEGFSGIDIYVENVSIKDAIFKNLPSEFTTPYVFYICAFSFAFSFAFSIILFIYGFIQESLKALFLSYVFSVFGIILLDQGRGSKEFLSGEVYTYVEKTSITGVFSQYLILRIGESPVLFISALFFMSAVALFVYCIVAKGSLRLLFLDYLFFIFGVELYSMRDYYWSRKCNKCGREFAYVQTRDPLVVDNHSEVETTKWFRCKYCGHEYVEEKTMRIYEQP